MAVTFTRRAVAPVARRLLSQAGSRGATAVLAGSASLGVSGAAARVLVREAARRLEAEQPDRARQILTALVRRPPRDASTALSVAELVRAAGGWQDSAGICATLLRRPDLSAGQRSQVLVELSWAEDARGDRPAAIARLTEALEIAPRIAAWRQRVARWTHRLGRLREEAGEWRAAATAYEEALALHPKPAGWHFRLGLMREQLGEWVPAAAAYDEAVARNGSHPTWHRRLAQARIQVVRVALADSPARVTPLESYPHVPRAGLVAPLQEGAVTGWIPAGPGADPTVLIKLNGATIADTRATVLVTLPDGHEFLRFRRAIRDLWRYAGAGDVLEFEHAGRPLAMTDGTLRYVFRDLASHSDELLAKLADGHIFNKYGRVRRAITGDSDWQSAMFELYGELRRELSEELGLELFPFYGTMLGAVRDQDFISHDNDFDTVYISRHSHPDAVRAEFRDLCNFLIDRSYSLRVKKSHTWVKVPGTPHKLDIFFAWFDPDGLFQVSYGHHGTAVPRSDDFFRFRTERLGSQQIPVPANAEEILEQLYGPGWRTPDPGFTHGSPTRVLRREYHLGTSEVNEAYWRQFYREHRIVGGSSFAEFVAGRLPAGRTVLEFGCGTGRDSIFLAKLGHTVAAADLSPEAIARAEEARKEAGVGNARFEMLDVSSHAEVARFLDRCRLDGADAGQVAVYLRFFLHSIDESIEEVLLANLVDLLPGGFTLYAEFRTTRDRDLPKVYGEHSRRYIDEQAFAAKLTGSWAFEMEHLEAGRGLAPYRGEDPHVARIVARAPARPAAT